MCAKHILYIYAIYKIMLVVMVCGGRQKAGRDGAFVCEYEMKCIRDVYENISDMQCSALQ